MSSSMIPPRALADQLGVSRQAVEKAIRCGRVPAYDKAGRRVGADYRGRKFLDPEAAAVAFNMNRSRIDDHVVDDLAGDDGDVNSAGRTLVDAKAEKERLQAELLKLKLERERAELVSRRAQLDALETAGRTVGRQFQTMTAWAEEIEGIARAGGVPALTAWLRAKAAECCSQIADKLVTSEKPDDDAVRKLI